MIEASPARRGRRRERRRGVEHGAAAPAEAGHGCGRVGLCAGCRKLIEATSRCEQTPLRASVLDATGGYARRYAPSPGHTRDDSGLRHHTPERPACPPAVRSAGGSAHRAPRIRNGPNGMYGLQGHPSSDEQDDDDDARHEDPGERHPQDGSVGARDQPDRHEQLDVAEAERARPEQQRRQVEQRRDDDRGGDRRQIRPSRPAGSGRSAR